MSVIGYLIKTSYKQKKQDWAEYQDLKKLLVQTKEEVKSKRSALHATDFRASYVLDDLMPINKKYCFTTVVDTIGDDVYAFDTECEHFYGMNCHNTGCELYKKNQDYRNVCADAARLAQEVSDFWNKKFAHVR